MWMSESHGTKVPTQDFGVIYAQKTRPCIRYTFNAQAHPSTHLLNI